MTIDEPVKEVVWEDREKTAAAYSDPPQNCLHLQSSSKSQESLQGKPDTQSNQTIQTCSRAEVGICGGKEGVEEDGGGVDVEVTGWERGGRWEG